MERVLSVSQLNEYVRRTLAADPMLKGVRLGGEISNFKRHSSGHLYFTLKDDEAKISCVMFRSAAMQMRISPKDGMRVVARGSVALYAATGQYQFYVDSMRDDGVGDLHIAFERLKARLLAEGLFDAGRKRPLPLLPRGVGIVTSATGAVVHDIEQVARRRHPGVRLYLRPCAVQGEGAAEDIVRAIAELENRPEIDVIIIGRGGGSLEELWAFNEEIVARAIFASKKPVISAVGHETDFTIADFVADVRAATPSQAAEICVPELLELKDMLGSFIWRMEHAMERRFSLCAVRLEALYARLRAGRPKERMAHRALRLEALSKLILTKINSALMEKGMRLSALHQRMLALSPEAVLARGYAVLTDMDGKPIAKANDARVGDAVRVRLSEGTLRAEIMEVDHGA